MISESNLADDPLRCLRAARLAATHGLMPDRRTSAACRRVAPTLAGVARERVQAELSKLLEVRQARPALAWAWRSGVLPPALGLSIPEEKWKGLERRLAAVDSIPLRALPGPRRCRFRLALLAADLEMKPAEVAAWLRRLRWSTEEASDVARLSELSASARETLTDDEAWLWILRAGEQAGDALRLAGALYPRSRGAVRRLAARLRRKRPVADVRGGDILEWLGVPPGPRIGQLLEAVRVESLAGRVRTRAEARRWLQMRERKGAAAVSARGGPASGGAAL
jgi:tRNA nucleotidyltransferase/poly(A) polymerase